MYLPKAAYFGSARLRKFSISFFWLLPNFATGALALVWSQGSVVFTSQQSARVGAQREYPRRACGGNPAGHAALPAPPPPGCPAQGEIPYGNALVRPRSVSRTHCVRQRSVQRSGECRLDCEQVRTLRRQTQARARGEAPLSKRLMQQSGVVRTKSQSVTAFHRIRCALRWLAGDEA